MQRSHSRHSLPYGKIDVATKKLYRSHTKSKGGWQCYKKLNNRKTRYAKHDACKLKEY